MSVRQGREYWERVVAELEGSSLSHVEFARQHRVHVGSLRGWLYRLRRERLSASVPRMLPVRVETPPPASGPGVVEIHVLGVVVRVPVGTEPSYVAELVGRLRVPC